MSGRKIAGLFEFPVIPDWADRWVYRELTAGHDVVEGVKYHWELAGPNGAAYFLLVEPHHTNEQIKRAADYLRMQHDVVRMWWVDMSVARKAAEALQTMCTH